MIDLDDILSAAEAAALAETTQAYMYVLIARGHFPEPVRQSPNLWLRRDVEAWKAEREAVKQ